MTTGSPDTCQIPLQESSPLEEAIRLKVIQTRGRPILMLDRDHNPQLPEGETPFVADDVLYSGNFVKIALNVAHRVGQPDNVLADLLWSWFGASAGRVMAGGLHLLHGGPCLIMTARNVFARTATARGNRRNAPPR